MGPAHTKHHHHHHGEDASKQQLVPKAAPTPPLTSGSGRKLGFPPLLGRRTPIKTQSDANMIAGDETEVSPDQALPVELPKPPKPSFRQGFCRSRSPKEFPWTYYTKQELGEGITGDVIKVVDAHGRERAVKTSYHSFDRTDEAKLQELRRELGFLRLLDHPNLSRLIEVFEDDENVKFVIDMCRGGNLASAAGRARLADNENNIRYVLYQIFLAVKYVHNRGIAHRDIKEENIMFVSPNQASLQVQLIDFGLSNIERAVVTNGKMEIERFHTFCGTLPYMSPEVLAASYDLHSDLWSLGVLSYELLTGDLPFNGAEKDMMKKIKKGKIDYSEAVWKTRSPDALDLVQNLLVMDAEKRWTADTALKSKWFDPCRLAIEASVDDKFESKIVESISQFSRLTPLRKLCMLTYAHFCSAASEIHHWFFISMDLNRSGTISEDELIFLWEKHLQSRDDAVHDFAALDVDQTGEVSWTNMLAAMLTNNIINDKLAMGQVFDYLAKGRHNLKLLDCFELASTSAQLLRDGTLRAELELADEDHDGSITKEEFLRLLFPTIEAVAVA